MNLRKPDWKGIIIMIETAIIFFILFHNWDAVKDYIAGIFS